MNPPNHTMRIEIAQQAACDGSVNKRVLSPNIFATLISAKDYALYVCAGSLNDIKRTPPWQSPESKKAHPPPCNPKIKSIRMKTIC